MRPTCRESSCDSCNSDLGMVGYRGRGFGTFSRLGLAGSCDFACFLVSVRYNSDVDGVSNRRRRRGSGILIGSHESGETRKRCKFCRGFFTPNPNQARHDFCRDECRKNYHKYGALPLVKLKADLTREFSRMIASLNARLDALESTAKWSHELGTPVEPWDAKRGGGTGA